MALPQTNNFIEHVKGTTFEAVAFTFQENGAPINLTGVAIKIEFRKGSKTGPVQKQCEIGSGITVPTPTNGRIVLDAFVADMPLSTYYYDVKLIFSPTVVKVYIGGILPIVQNVTQ